MGTLIDSSILIGVEPGRLPLRDSDSYATGRICCWTVADDFDSERFPGNFYPGMISRLDRARGRGVVRSHTGKEIPFQFPFVQVVGAQLGGAMPGIELLREGDSVGFDVGWTRNGLRVTVIRPRSASDSI